MGVDTRAGRLAFGIDTKRELIVANQKRIEELRAKNFKLAMEAVFEIIEMESETERNNEK